VNRKYAISILETVERGTLEPNCSLAKEAFEYLKRRKKTTVEELERIYKIQFN